MKWKCPAILGGPGKYLKTVGAIDEALTFWKGPRRRAIQAGAHIGIWPRRLSELFASVVCFEPSPENAECVSVNLQGTAAVFYRGVLVESQRLVDVALKRKSTATHYVTKRHDRASAKVDGFCVDQFGFDDVDAIFLDVEGAEMLALKGAVETIRKTRPLIVAEECGYCRRLGYEPGDMAAFLGEMGYTQVGVVGVDLVFVSK